MTVAFVVAIAILLGLLLFLYNEMRRSPGPAEWGHVPRWAKRLRVAFAAITLFFAGCFFWGFLVEPGRLVTRRQTIQIDNWPPQLDGLRIAVLSDIHVDNWFITDKKLRTIVTETNQLHPDLIVILGDYMSGDGWVRHRVEPDVFGPILKDLHALLGARQSRLVVQRCASPEWPGAKWNQGARKRVCEDRCSWHVVLARRLRGSLDAPAKDRHCFGNYSRRTTVDRTDPQSRHLSERAAARAIVAGGAHSWRASPVTNNRVRRRVVGLRRPLGSRPYL